MVKNYGGNKAKKQGRKYATQTLNKTTRFAKDEAEIYGAVTKIYGGGRAEFKCIDGELRHLIIRNKFKGRSRRDNNIEAGTWVLGGKRTWEVIKEGAKETCDLLEVYDTNDIENIKESVSLPWQILKINSLNNDNVNKDDNIVFNNNEEFDNVCNEELKLDSDDDIDSDIDIDDI